MEACSKRIEEAIAEASAALGYSQLKPKQAEALQQFLSGKDVFICLPTGSGKTLCFSLLPLAFDVLKGTKSSIVVIVSPLIALMKDQVRKMTEKNMRALYVGECDHSTEVDVCDGKYQMLYFSPELLLTNPVWRDMLQSDVYCRNLVAFVIDEAHCVKKWGDSFRKEFSNLGDVRSLIPSTVRVMALTATATKSSRREIIKKLRMVHPAIISVSPNKPNIKYCVKFNADSLEQSFAPIVEELRRERKQMRRTIIFCRSYDQCSRIYMYMANRLGREMMDPVGTSSDIPQFRLIDMYTACTCPAVKESILNSIPNPNGVLRVIVATIAFGMGLDCPNIRKVIHWGPSADVESYLQETGRAGRDGETSEAILYYTNTALGQLDDANIKEYCKNKTTCRREMLLRDFDHEDSETLYSRKCLCCDVCDMKCVCSCCTKV